MKVENFFLIDIKAMKTTAIGGRYTYLINDASTAKQEPLQKKNCHPI